MPRALLLSSLLLALAMLLPTRDAVAGREVCRFTFPTATGEHRSIAVIGWSHEVVSPRDAASGLPTGKRQHKPVTVTKPVDATTPLLLEAFSSGRALPAVQVRCDSPAAAGKEEQHYTIELLNASIVGVRSEVETRVPRGQAPSDREHVSFTYDKIVRTWTSREGSFSLETEVDETGTER